MKIPLNEVVKSVDIGIISSQSALADSKKTVHFSFSHFFDAAKAK